MRVRASFASSRVVLSSVVSADYELGKLFFDMGMLDDARENLDIVISGKTCSSRIPVHRG